MAASPEVLNERLAGANRVRAARAEWKRQAGLGEVTDALAHPPEFLRTATVAGVVRLVPKIGPVKVRQMMRTAGVSDGAKLGGLTQRQRYELIRVLMEWEIKAGTRR
jgi:hypothetical protein